MFLKELDLYAFKNYQQAALRFVKPVVCIVGANGSGKTNLLDAIHMICMARSYFQGSDKECIHHGEHGTALRAIFIKDGEDFNVSCKMRLGKRKEISLNKVSYDKIADHVGSFPVVVIAPDDLKLVEGHSEDRRRFIDQSLAQVSNAYLDALMQYNRTLQQRNAVLKDALESRRWNKDLIDTYNAGLSQFGQMIYEQRKAFVKDLLPLFIRAMEGIIPSKETLSVRYSSELDSLPMSELLEQRWPADRASGRTTAGIHRDDLVFKLGDHPLKRFGSQGQRKSFLIAIKKAQYQWLKQRKELSPILLLDDLFDRLDGGRSSGLLNSLLEDDMGQIFITDTRKEQLESFFKEHAPDSVQFIEIDAGKIR